MTDERPVSTLQYRLVDVDDDERSDEAGLNQTQCAKVETMTITMTKLLFIALLIYLNWLKLIC